MLYKRQLAWTNGSGNPAYKVVSWAVGCQPETGWEEMNWKVMQKFTGPLWEPASQIGSEPKAPPLWGMALPTTPSPLHIATGSTAMAPGACMLQVTTATESSLPSPVQIPERMHLTGRAKVTSSRTVAWELGKLSLSIFHLFGGIKFCFIPRLLRVENSLYQTYKKDVMILRARKRR